MTVEQTNIKVAVRVRPYNRRELEHKQRCIINILDETSLLFDPEDEDDEFFYQGTKQTYRDMTKRVNKKLSMEFDRVYDLNAQNEQIFAECTAPIVDSVLNGYNGSVFVYGATGAGKTFTMLGGINCPGLAYLTMSDLFEKINAQSNVHKFDVAVSYLEVYNELVINLLSKSAPLKLREDSHGVIVSGLVLRPIKSAVELLDLLAIGNANRTQHPTDANAESSRSHAVFQVHVRMTELKTNTKRTVKLSMIDLAGSERAASTKGIGVRFKEGANINKSLLALGNCINKLADGNKHIPYRDSNLTRLLKDSLGGNCRTLMIANVSMSSLTYEDTYNTLKYASRAKKIRTILKQNILKSNMPKDFYIKKTQDLLEENERLKDANKMLESKLLQLQKSTSGMRGYDENELKPWYKKIDLVFDSIIKSAEFVTGLQSKIKSIKFRIKLRQDSGRFMKLLTLSKADVAEDIAKFTTAVNSFSNQIDTHRQELQRWRKNLQESNKEVVKLKKEIDNLKFGSILNIYLEKKELELQNRREETNFNHISSIISDFVQSSDKWRKEFELACEILQKSYIMLNTNHQLTPEMLSSFEYLRSLICNINTNFKTDYVKKISKTLAIENNLSSSHQKKRPQTSEDDEDSELPSPPKRMQLNRLLYDDIDLGLDDAVDDTDSDNCFASSSSTSIFKVPYQRKLNETQVLSSTDDDSNANSDLNIASKSNSTIILSTGKSRLFGAKKNLVCNILSDQISRAPPHNKTQLKNVLLRSNISHQGLLKAVAVGVQKENRKYSPNRIRKSPRDPKTKVSSSTSVHVVRNKTSRTVTNGTGEPPLVRINRAASFRVKK